MFRALPAIASAAEVAAAAVTATTAVAASAATAAATSTTTAASAAVKAAVFTRLRLVDLQLTAVVLGAVEFGDGSFALFLRRHLNKTKTA